MESKDLFGNTTPLIQPAKGHEIKWRFVTNHQNLMFILSAGLIMPPSGFGKKYYQDTLSLVSGWIPLFPEVIWSSAIDHSIAEQSFLRPCYAELDLSNLSGHIKVFRSGSWQDASFPGDIYGDEDLILVPAPLPTSMIKEIVFSSKEDKTYCDKDAKNFFNVPLGDFKTKVASASFKKAKSETWPPVINNTEVRKVELTLPDSLGGVLSLLSWLSNKDETVGALTKAFFDQNIDNSVITSFPMLAGTYEIFFSKNVNTDQHGASSVLFASITNSLIQFRKSSEIGTPKDVIMEIIEGSNFSLEGKAKLASERLIEDLKGIVQFPDKTITELLETHQKPLPRSLILFFMNEDMLDLLETNNILLTGNELCGVAILHGISEGWMRVPSSLRERNGLNHVVPVYMAQLSHELSGSTLKLGALPERPRSLLDLFSEKLSDSKGNNAALYIARACKWDCIKTHVKLGKGDYQLRIDGSGVCLILDGDVKTVESFVDQEKFMALLRAEPIIPVKIENEARMMLGS